MSWLDRVSDGALGTWKKVKGAVWPKKDFSVALIFTDLDTQREMLVSLLAVGVRVGEGRRISKVAYADGQPLPKKVIARRLIVVNEKDFLLREIRLGANRLEPGEKCPLAFPLLAGENVVAFSIGTPHTLHVASTFSVKIERKS